MLKGGQNLSPLKKIRGETMNCYSRGSILAPIMIVGEGPGKDEIGHVLKSPGMESVSVPIPFAGKSGQLLQQILQWAGIEEGDYIMTNVVKFFPTDDRGRTRRPTEKEISEDAEILIQEIQKIRPKMIISVGATAYWALTQKEKIGLAQVRIGEVNGKISTLTVSDGFNIDIMPIYHPAAILRGDADRKKEYKKAIASAFVRNLELISKAVERPLFIR